MIVVIGHLRDDLGTYEYFDFDLSPEDSGEGCSLLTPVHASCSVVFGGNAFLVSGKLNARVEMPCVRCLTPVVQELDFDFDEEFDEALLPGEEASLDLGDLAAQTWLTSLPMRVLCKEDCAGLCPQCGKNLNDGPCDCKEEELDPRLEILKEYRDKEE